MTYFTVRTWNILYSTHVKRIRQYERECRDYEEIITNLLGEENIFLSVVLS